MFVERNNLSGRLQAALAGCYDGHRTAALSGVPVSTIYYWARQGIVIPTVSPNKQKLWSYADLMALRIVYWLRHPKPGRLGEIPGSQMTQVRETLEELERRDLDIWAENTVQRGSPLRVDQTGRVHLDDGWAAGMSGQLGMLPVLDLLGPFEVGDDHGPDLIRPRSRLRIVPGKVSGEPHFENSRIATRAIAALYRRMGDIPSVAALYPEVDHETVEQAIDLEHDLAA